MPLLNTTSPQPSHKLLQQLFDALQEVVCVLDTQGTFIYLNNACLTLWGYAPSELIGKSCFDIILPEDHERTIQSTIVGQQRIPTFENRYIRKDGSIAYMSWEGVWDVQNQLIYGTGRDITEAKHHLLLEYQYKEQLEQLLDRITDGFLGLDKEARVFYWNKAATAISGLSQEQMIGHSLWEVLPEPARSIAMLQLKHLKDHQKPLHEEYFFERTERWIEVHAYSSGSGVSVFFRDVSERRKRAEEQARYEQRLRKQHKQLVDVLERIKHGFVSLDPEFRIRYWNKQAEIFVGYTKEQVMGQPISNWYHKEAVEFYLPLCEKAMKEQQPIHTEHICPENSKWVDMSIYPTEEGVSIFFENIHERKQQEEELRMLSLVASQTENTVIILSPDRKVTWVNAAFTRTTGYMPQEVIGKAPTEFFVGPETNPETVHTIKEGLQKKKPFEVEILSYKKDGKKFWAELHIEPVFDTAGKLTHFFSIRKDITDRKRLQEVVEEEKRQRQRIITAATIAAQERERAQVGTELHDNVNQVLTSVKLYQDLLLSGIGNQEELLRKSSTLLQQSINEIRSLSKRLSAPTIGNIKLKDSIRELVEMIAATNHFKIELEAEAITELEVSEELHLALYRILQEHLTNVLKYAAASNVEVSLDILDAHLVLQVVDNGKGFDPGQKSNGIGITNMRSRAESLNGTLAINSAPNQGCTLLASFPLEE